MASNAFALRSGACFAILFVPLALVSARDGHPVSALALALCALLFAVPALGLALAMGRDRPLRRVLLFAALIALFLDLEVEAFDGAIAALATLGVVGVLWLLREHLSAILFAAFATMLVASFLVPGSEAVMRTEARSAGEHAAGRPAAEGRVVHLLLDAFSSPDALPRGVEGGRALAAEVGAFFRQRGFSLHGDAISEYASSRDSIATILDLDRGRSPASLRRGKRPYVLHANAWFEWLRDEGFAVRVHQSAYMDFCSAAPIPIASCTTYRYDTARWVGDAALGDVDQAAVLLGMLLNRPDFFEVAMKAWVRLRHAAARTVGLRPARIDWDGQSAPIVALEALAHLQDEVLAAPPGTAHFAHLLLPHGPFVFDEDCALTGAPLEWPSARPLHRRSNDADGRRRRYVRYFAQVRCTLARLGAFFDALEAKGLWRDATIVVHGDHGARIWRTPPRAGDGERWTERDVRDGFGTLFAVKPAGGAAAAFDPGPTTVARLLAQTAGRVDPGPEKRPPVVRLEAEDGWLEVPWPGPR